LLHQSRLQVPHNISRHSRHPPILKLYQDPNTPVAHLSQRNVNRNPRQHAHHEPLRHLSAPLYRLPFRKTSPSYYLDYTREKKADHTILIYRTDCDPVVQIRWDAVSNSFPQERGSDGDGRKSFRGQGQRLEEKPPFDNKKLTVPDRISLMLITVVDHAL
jgi:hypothetical protein